MRLFTALTVAACAFAMGACSEPAFNEAFDGGMTRGGNGEFIGFHKVVQTGENTTRPAIENEFTFNLYEVDKKGEVALIFAGLTTDTNGDVWFDDFTKFKGQGRTYFFKEVFASEEEEAKWEPLDELHFAMESNFGTHWNDERGSWEFNQGPVIKNIPVPEEEPIVPEFGKPIGSVTLTKDRENPTVLTGTGNDHFCYVELSIAELTEGITLQMVVGDKFDLLGEAFVKLNEEGKITITVDDPEAVFGADAVTTTPDFDNHRGLKHDNIFPACPEADPIYLYVHFDKVRFIVE